MKTVVFLVVLCGLVALFSVAGSWALFGGYPNLPPLNYNALAYWLGIANVLLGIGAAAGHMALTQGWRATVLLMGLCVLIAGGAELLGTTTGFPFGPYTYTDRLGPKFLGHVPYLIPPSWFMVLYPAIHLSYALGVPRWGVPFVSALLLTWWDVAMDPAVTTGFPYWVWHVEGEFYGMPLVNWLGWYATGLVISVVYLRFAPEWKPAPIGIPLALWLIQGGQMAGLAWVFGRIWAAVLWAGGAVALLGLLYWRVILPNRERVHAG
ncbi:MAG: carotenoid biosynthesis protein [Armatimonadetes bacterium]|nr:carotenoid biosynthesis protein [Armatimonadota bacterium]GIV13841.1 MAG: hypothetical protein KatS3mg021_2123 [Fimbriimonadales bacterium]